MTQTKLALALALLSAFILLIPSLLSGSRYQVGNSFSIQDSKDNGTWISTFLIDEVKSDPKTRLIPIHEVWVECVVREKSLFGLTTYVEKTDSQKLVITYPRHDWYQFTFASVGKEDDPNSVRVHSFADSNSDKKRLAFTFLNLNTPNELVLKVTRYDLTQQKVLNSPIGELHLRRVQQ